MSITKWKIFNASGDFGNLFVLVRFERITGLIARCIYFFHSFLFQCHSITPRIYSIQLILISYNINDISDFVTQETQVTCFDSSPNGLYIACVHENKIQVYDLQSANQVGQDMIGEAEEILDIRYSINGEYIFSGGDDHDIYIWDTTTYQQDKALIGHTNDVISLAISPDGLHLASSSYDQTIRIWNLKDRVCQSVIPVLTAHSLQYSISGQYLSYISQLQIITVHTRRLAIIQKIQSSNLIERIQINQSILVSDSGKQAEYFDKSTGKQIRKLYRGHDQINGVAISPNKKFIAIIEESEMSVFDTSRGKRYGPLVDDCDCWFHELKFQKDGKYMLTSNHSGVLRTSLLEFLKA